jgi:hypothetical protein
MIDAINIECQLLSWAETSNGGAKIVLQLADADDLERFKSMTLAKGRGKTAIAGQRLACAFVEIGDDEQPVQRESLGLADDGREALRLTKGGPLAQLAGRWCEDERFRGWLFDTFTAEAVKAMRATTSVNGQPDNASIAAKVVRKVCGVASRAELDHDPEAAALFHVLIRAPYQAHLQGS